MTMAEAEMLVVCLTTADYGINKCRCYVNATRLVADTMTKISEERIIKAVCFAC